MIISNDCKWIWYKTMCAQSPQSYLLMVCHDFANLFMAIVLLRFLLLTPHSEQLNLILLLHPIHQHVSYIFLVECHMNSTISNGAATNWEAPWTHRGFFAGLILRLLRGNHRMDAFIQSFSLACPGGGIGGFMNGQATKSRKAIWRGVYSRWVSKWRVSLSIFRTRPNKTGTH